MICSECSCPYCGMPNWYCEENGCQMVSYIKEEVEK